MEVESVVSELRLSPDMLRGRRAIGIVISLRFWQGPEWRVARPEYSIVCANGKPRWFCAKAHKGLLGADILVRGRWL